MAAKPEVLALPCHEPVDVAIVVKTCRAHRRSYVELQRDLIVHGHLAVRVCVPREHLAAFEPVVHRDFELVSNEQVLCRFGRPWSLNDDWQSQQLFKLLLVASCEREVCWVLDANTLLQAPLPDAWHDGRVILALGHLQPKDYHWFRSSARFLDLPRGGPSIAAVNQPLRRSVVHGLLRRIARLHAQHPLDALIRAMRSGRNLGAPLWTEYGLYRSYAAHVARSAHDYGYVYDVAYYKHDRHGRQLDRWLHELQDKRPLMVKVYAQRPSYRLGDRELRVLCDRIRACR